MHVLKYDTRLTERKYDVWAFLNIIKWEYEYFSFLSYNCLFICIYV